MELINKIELIGILPVIKLGDAANAVPLAQALCEGGIPCAEITFRTQAAAEAIRNITEKYPEMLVGAGTVLTHEQADQAIEAGAKFIITPGMNPNTVEYCQRKGIPVIPGCATPGEIEKAIELGLKTVKFFPAEANGGISTIKAMGGPYSQIRFIPTGGISAKNVCEYLKCDNVLACGGTWMVPAKEIENRNFDRIRELTEEAVRMMHGFRLAHVGINCDDESQARKTAEKFDFLFGFKAIENPGSIFSGIYVENLKSPYFGTKGHIAIGVNSVERAKAYLNRKGIAFNEKSAVYCQGGKMQAIYMQDEICGFAIHLVRNPEDR